MTEWHKFRGREVDVLRWTPHAIFAQSYMQDSSTPTLAGSTASATEKVRSPSIRTSLLASNFFHSSSGWAGNELGERARTTDGGSQQGATLYDVPASAPVGRCSARKLCLYFRNIASSGGRFLLTIYFHFKSLVNASKLCRTSVPM